MYGFCAPSCSLPVLRNVLVSGNAGRYGGGIMFVGQYTDLTIACSTIVGNAGSSYGGGGLRVDGWSTVNMVDSVVAGNGAAPGYRQEIDVLNSTLTAAFSLIRGGDPSNPGAPWPGTGNLDADPLFINPLPPGVAPTAAGITTSSRDPRRSTVGPATQPRGQRSRRTTSTAISARAAGSTTRAPTNISRMSPPSLSASRSRLRRTRRRRSSLPRVTPTATRSLSL